MRDGALPGPGKYDTETTALRVATGGHTVVVIVFGGRLGEGFEVQSTSPTFTAELPALLRRVADSIDGALT
jgi:hypothetical protein